MFVENGYELLYFKENIIVNVYFIYKYIFTKVLTTSQSIGFKGQVLIYSLIPNFDKVIFCKIFIRDIVTRIIKKQKQKKKSKSYGLTP